MKVELIEWYDAHSNTGWDTREAYEDGFEIDLTISSVGHIVAESDARVVLLQSYSISKPILYDVSLIIPKGCIVKRTQLFEGFHEISEDSTQNSSN